jgi:gas vesicle protein
MKWPFLAGLGVGAAVGIFVAPKSGAELRGDIEEAARTSYEQGRDKLQSLLEEAHRRMQPAMDAARERIEPFVDSAREQVATIVEESMDEVSNARDRVAEAVGEGGSLMAILNEWPHDRLIEIDGIGPVLASKIIQHRPYKSEEELVESKHLPPSAIESLREAA